MFKLMVKLIHVITYFLLPISSCDVGYYCPGGTEQQIQCANGYYQESETQASCDLCDAGHYCNNSGGVISSLGSLTMCPEGYYCPNGTSFYTDHPCPLGTFNPHTGNGRKALTTLVFEPYHTVHYDIDSLFCF